MKPIILNIRVRIDTIDSHFANSDPTFTRSKRSNDRKEGAVTPFVSLDNATSE